MRGTAILLCAWLAFAAGCERIDVSDEQSSGEQTTTTSLRVAAPDVPPFARADARLMVAHTGVRRLVFPLVNGPGSDFRERITTDGHGSYALEPLNTLDAYSSSDDWDLFGIFQHAREGFYFRYRDFVVRDPATFARNWRATELDNVGLVAGRSCKRYRVERVVGEARTIELAVDAETNLILSSRELDATGQLVAALTYESFRLDPPLGGVAWHAASNAETALDPLREISEQIQARPMLPRLLPQGYTRYETAKLVDGDGQDWLKLTFSDGVETLFLLHKIEAVSLGKAAPLDGTMGHLPREESSVTVFKVGSAIAVQGHIDGVDVIAIGSVPEVELLDLIESALP